MSDKQAVQPEDLQAQTQSQTGQAGQVQFDFVEASVPDESMQQVRDVLGATPEPESGQVVFVTEDQVRQLLEYGFQAGVLVTGHQHWRATPEELDRVVPGLTRLINRWPFLAGPVARASALGDWGSVGYLTWMVIRRYLASLNIWRAQRQGGTENGRQSATEPNPTAVGHQHHQQQQPNPYVIDYPFQQRA